MAENLATQSRVAAAMGDGTRLRLLKILWNRGETCVCELVEELKGQNVRMTQSNLSFHLNTLKHAGLVADRKIGKWVFYTVNHEAVDAFLGGMREFFHLDEKSSAASCDSVYSLCCAGKLPLSRGHVVEMVQTGRLQADATGERAVTRSSVVGNKTRKSAASSH